MQDFITEYVNELSQDPDVLGVILGGSQARGNARPDSDADLILIVPDGFRRGLEQRGDRFIETIAISEELAAAYFASNPDVTADVWASARILLDRDGACSRLEQQARRQIEAGKPAIGEDEHRSSRFNSADQLRAAGWLHRTDPAAGRLVLHHKVLELTASLFDYRRLWTPLPKQRMARIAEVEPRMHALLVDFYADGGTFAEQLALAERMLPLVYDE